MLRLTRHLLTAPVRSLYEWMAKRASRVRYSFRRARPKITASAASPTKLLLEPYESRSQIGGRAEAVILGLTGLSFAALQEPIVAMIQVVGQEPLLPTIDSRSELVAIDPARMRDFADAPLIGVGGVELPEGEAPAGDMVPGNMTVGGERKPEPEKQDVDPGQGGPSLDEEFPNATVYMPSPEPYPDSSHYGGGGGGGGSDPFSPPSSSPGGGDGGVPSVIGGSNPVLAMPSPSGTSSLTSAPAIPSGATTATHTEPVLAATPTAVHRTTAISLSPPSTSFPSSQSFHQPLQTNPGTTRDPRSAPTPSPWQGFQPPLFTSSPLTTNTTVPQPVVSLSAATNPASSPSTDSVPTDPAPTAPAPKTLAAPFSTTTSAPTSPPSTSPPAALPPPPTSSATPSINVISSGSAGGPAIPATSAASPADGMAQPALAQPTVPEMVASAVQPAGVHRALVGRVTIVRDDPTSSSIVGTTLSAVEGQEFSGTVATFTPWASSSSGSGGLAGSGSGLTTYTASINWGDGSTSPGSVSGTSVWGDHTYMEEGSYTVSVTITDSSGSSEGVTETANVADALLSPGSGGSINVVEGTSFSGTVATFSDAGPGPGNETSGGDAEYTVSISWGDGNKSGGTVSAGGTSGTYVVSGSHQYTDEGSYPVTVTITDDGGSSTTVTTTATVTDAALHAGENTSFTAVEGESSTWNVGSFTDDWPEDPSSDYSVWINWGDSTPSTSGTIDGSFAVFGSHAFAEEGSFTVTVSVTDNSAATVLTATAKVSDAPLSPGSGAAISGTEGVAWAGQVATFTDPAPEPGSSYSVTIDWGDKSTTAGSAAGALSGLFYVSGSHTYADEGDYTISVTIIDEGGASVQVDGTATIGDAALYPGSSSPVSAVEGKLFSGTLATFSDAWPEDPGSDYAVSINWGDLTPATSGTIDSSFAVHGTHTFAEEGNYTVTVTVTDNKSAATMSTMATVSDAPLTGVSNPDIHGVEGQQFSGNVGEFQDTDPETESAGNYTASIDWGDGSLTAGAITGLGSNQFVVSGQHAYAEENSYTVKVVAYDHGASVSLTGTAVVDDAPLTGGGVGFDAVEGSSFAGLQVATFTDTGIGTASDFTATINWGDGTAATTGTVTGSSGAYTIAGSHKYVEEGDFTVTVTVNDDGGAAVTMSASVTVADAKLTATGWPSISKKEQETFDGQVGTFSDPAPESPGEYTATINWGDDTPTTTGIVSAGGISGTFVVSGSHKYDEEGKFAVSVHVVDNPESVDIIGTATIDDAPLSAGTGASISKVEGETYTGVVATFSDPAPEAATEYTVSINWGDGTTGDGGTVTQTGTNSYQVTGSHKFAEEGKFTVGVTITDHPEQVTVFGSANVTDASLSPSSTSLSTTEGATFTGSLGQFTDAGGGEVSDFTATINWGDGKTSPGTVAAGGGTGVYTVSGSHTYDDEGNFSVSVSVSDDGGASAAWTDPMTVKDAPLSGSANALSMPEGGSYSGVVANFSDGFPEAISAYGATIQWGDGTSSTGVIGTSGTGFTVSGSHVYDDEPDPDQEYTLTVTVRDEGGAVATLSAHVDIQDAPLVVDPTVSMSPISGIEGSSIPFTVSWNGTDDETSSSFSVAVAGGEADGPIEVAGSKGAFTATGKLKFLEEGSYPLVATVTASTGASGVAKTYALVEDPDLTNQPADALDATVNEPTPTVVVAKFGDPHSSDGVGDYTAWVDWGDGTGHVEGHIEVLGGTGGSASFEVTADPHTYHLPGTYDIHTHITEDGWTKVDADTTITVDPIDPWTLDLTSKPIFGEEQAIVSGTLAKFTAADNQTAFAALIDWGDKTGWQVGTVAQVDFERFAVTSSHTYASYGSYFVRIEVQDGTRNGLIGTTAVIADESISVSLNSLSFPTNSNISNVVVGTINDPADPSGDYSATIYWGDGGASEGHIYTMDGQTKIYASHEYIDSTPAYSAIDSHLKAILVVRSAGGSIKHVLGDATTTHWPEDSTWPSGEPIVKFTDERIGLYSEESGDFTATVWVGESSFTGTVTGIGTNRYEVKADGVDPFGEASSVPTVISVDAYDDGGAELHYERLVTVLDTPLDNMTGHSFSGNADESLAPTVGDFSIPNLQDPEEEVGELTGEIDWGDGTTGTASIAFDSESSLFEVTGEHTYGEPGDYTVVVEVSDEFGHVYVLDTTAAIADPAEFETPVEISAMAQVRQNDPDRGEIVPVGDAQIALNTGSVRLSQALDFDLSPGNAVAGSPALVYNSATAGSDPVIEAVIQVPTDQEILSIEARLTWNNGEPDDWITFPVTEESSTGVYTIQLEHYGGVDATWLYHYQVDLKVHFADQDDGGLDPPAEGDNDDVVTTASVEGFDPIVVQNTSEFGAGWGLDGWSRIVASPDGILRVFGNGDFRVYGTDGGRDVSFEDFGDLQVIRDDHGNVLQYIYTDTYQNKSYYTAEGQLTGVVDPHDLTLGYSYNFGLFDTVTSPDTAVTTFVQGTDEDDEEGLTTEIDEPGSGRAFHFTHNGDGDLVLTIDAQGFTRDFSYGGHLLENDTWGPRSVSYGYSSTGSVTSIDRGGGVTLSVLPASIVVLESGEAIPDQPYAETTTALSETTYSLLDANGRIWQRIRPDGSGEDWDRNESGDPLIYQDPDGYLTTYSYDGAGDTAEVDSPDGSTVYYAYDGTFHQMITMEDGDENVTTYSLNSTGDVISMTDPELKTTTYSWSAGLLLSTTDPLLRTTYTSYDGYRRPTALVPPEGDGTYTTYDANGNVYSTSDNTGDTTFTYYDKLNRLVGTMDPDENPTETVYDAPGDPVETTDTGGLVTDRTYDGRGILVLEEVGTNVPGGERDTEYVPDPDGNIILTVDPMGRAVVCSFDSLGRQTSETTGQWDGTGFTGPTRTDYTLYDPDGNETLSVDPAGRGIARIPDGMGRTLEEVFGQWVTGIGFVGPVEMTDHYYDADGNETLTVDPREIAIATEFDPDGRAWRVFDDYGGPNETVTDTLYDDDGNATGTITGVGSANPELTKYYYDGDGRVTMTVDAVGRAQGTVYNSDGQVAATGDGLQLALIDQRWTYYSYDPDGRVLVTTDPTGHEIGQLYNPVGEVTETIDGLELPSGQQEIFYEEYDPFYEDDLSTDPMGRETAFLRNADGEATVTILGFELGSSGWKEEDADFNAFGENDATLEETTNEHEVVTYTNADGQPMLTVEGADLPLDQQRWTYSYYDEFGNLTLSIDPMGRATAYAYNADNQVVEVVEGYGTTSARAAVTLYDDLGRVTATIEGYGTSDAVTSTTQYDAQGNVVLTTDPMGHQTGYLYDLDNELTATVEGVELSSTFWRITAEAYDGFGEETMTVAPNGLKLLSTFDKDGRLTSSTQEALDALGVLRDRTTSYFLDAFGNATLTVDPVGRRTAATYDADNEAVTVTVGTTHTESTTSWRDHFGNVVLAIDALNHETATTYDFYNQPAVVTVGVDLSSSLWETSRYFYDDFGETTLTIDDLGNEDEAVFDKDGEELQDIAAYGTGDAEDDVNLYDGLGQETETIDAAGDISRMVYDGLGREIGEIIAFGTTAAESQSTYYDADGHVTGTISGSGGLFRSFYNAFGDLTGTVDPTGRVSQFLYDLAGQQTESIDGYGTPEAITNIATLDGFGETVANTDGDGRTTSELTNADGEVTVSYDPAGHASYQYYDDLDRVTLSVDAAGHATASFYNDDNQVTLTIAGFGTVAAAPTYTNYDGLGRVSQTVDGDGRTQASFYDGDNHLTLSVAGYGSDNPQATQYLYDENGNVTTVIDGDGDETVTAYDHLNRAVTVTDGAGRVTHSYYDAAGNLTGTADQYGDLTQHVFDDQGREIETIDADTNVTLKYYDNDGNLTGEVDPDTNLTQYLYNAAGEQTETIDPLGHASYTYYDDSGLVTRTVDRMGRRIDDFYDAAGNLTLQVWTNPDSSAAGSKTYTYDGSGEMLSATNAVGTYTITYDGAGRVSEVDGPFGVNLTFGYDGGGNRSSATDNVGGETDSTFDAADRLSSRTMTEDSVTVSIDISYDAAGNEITRTRTDGSTSAGETDNLYDGAGHITSLITTDGSTTLVDEQYTYDLASRLHSKTVGGVDTIDYTYDPAGQLLTAGVDTYGYDPNGVPDTGGLTPGVNNQVSTDGLWTYTYDNAGELIEKSQGAAAPTWWYTYDHDGHMTQASYANDGSTVTVVVDYQYDVFGNLVDRTETDDGGVVSDQRFVMDGWDTAKPSSVGNENYDNYADLVSDGDGGWTVATLRVFGAGFDEPIASVTAEGAALWYAADRQGSVEAIFDTTGTSLESREFDPFGYLTSGTIVDPYAFQGGWVDTIVSEERFGWRWYDAETHQWTSEDKLGLVPGPNDRAFVWNGSTDALDPSGLAEDGQWHHVIPQALFKKHGLKADPNLKWNGVMIPAEDHLWPTGLHSDGYDKVVSDELTRLQATKPPGQALTRADLEPLVKEIKEGQGRFAKFNKYFGDAKKVEVSYYAHNPQRAGAIAKNLGNTRGEQLAAAHARVKASIKRADEVAAKKAAALEAAATNLAKAVKAGGAKAAKIGAKAAKSAGGKLAKTVRKAPIIGIAVIMYTWDDTVQAKGPEGAKADALFDTVIGIPKAGLELLTGRDVIPDLNEDKSSTLTSEEKEFRHAQLALEYAMDDVRWIMAAAESIEYLAGGTPQDPYTVERYLTQTINASPANESRIFIFKDQKHVESAREQLEKLYVLQAALLEHEGPLDAKRQEMQQRIEEKIKYHELILEPRKTDPIAFLSGKPVADAEQTYSDIQMLATHPRFYPDFRGIREGWEPAIAEARERLTILHSYRDAIRSRGPGQEGEIALLKKEIEKAIEEHESALRRAPR
jgi:RHS repeat-associated protein